MSQVRKTSTPIRNNPAAAARGGDFAPLDALEEIARRWWLVALLMLAGGLAGWLYRQVSPPMYEARAGFTVSYDLVGMGAMTPSEEDAASRAVGDLLLSTDVVQAAAADARARGYALDEAALKAMAAVERKGQSWTIRVRSTDPAQAAEIANLWAAQGDRALRDAAQAGIEAREYARYLAGVEACLQRSTSVEPASGACGIDNLAALQNELHSTGSQLADARARSRGILPTLLIAWNEKAEAPRRPVLLNVGLSVFTGSLVGLIAAALVELSANLPFLKRPARV